MSLPQPASSDRVCIMGPTGSGKTELARALLKAQQNVIVIDPKRQFSWEEDSPRYSRIAHDLDDLLRQLREVEEKGTGAPVIYRPPDSDLLPKNIDRLDAVYGLALARRHTLVYCDDFAFMATSANNFHDKIPNWFRAVTTGRSLHVGAWASFYRPSNVPLLAMSESDYRIAFFFRMKQDRKRAEELCGEIDWDALKRNDYSFVWATDQDCSGVTRLRINSKTAA